MRAGTGRSLILVLTVVAVLLLAGGVTAALVRDDAETALEATRDAGAPVSESPDPGATSRPSPTSDRSPSARGGGRDRSGEDRPDRAVAKDLPGLRALADQVDAEVERRAEAQRRKAREKRRPPIVTPPELPSTATFQVGTFNVLGASHTAPGGNKPGYASAAARLPWSLALIRRAGLDVVGLQEFQVPQFLGFRRATEGEWSVYPGVSRGRKPVQNSIAFRTDMWELEQGALVDIPYFHGRPFPMPFVLLEHRASGHHVWFVNIHNPASTRGNASRHRARGIAIEAALVNRLHGSGTPVVLTGDFNDRAGAFCPLVSRTALEAANGGSVAGACRPPANAGIDWIFATSDIQASDYVRDRSPLVRRTTDHPFVHADLTVTWPG